MTLIQTRNDSETIPPDSNPTSQYLRYSNSPATHRFLPLVGAIYDIQFIECHTTGLLVLSVSSEKKQAVVTPIVFSPAHPTVRDIRVASQHTNAQHEGYVLADTQIGFPCWKLSTQKIVGKIVNDNLISLIEQANKLSETELYSRSTQIGTATGNFIASEKGHLATQRAKLVTSLHTRATM